MVNHFSFSLNVCGSTVAIHSSSYCLPCPFLIEFQPQSKCDSWCTFCGNCGHIWRQQSSLAGNSAAVPMRILTFAIGVDLLVQLKCLLTLGSVWILSRRKSLVASEVPETSNLHSAPAPAGCTCRVCQMEVNPCGTSHICYEYCGSQRNLFQQAICSLLV